VHALIQRRLDDDSYSVLVRAEGGGTVVASAAQPHLFEIRPPAGATAMNVTVAFSATAPAVQSVGETLHQSVEAWQRFWLSGAAIEFDGSTDPRAAMLEKQVVMSMYMSRSQEAGSLPPQETALTSNSWYGKCKC